ncbi:MAG TPA: SPFH domain-containing protein [Polyangiaceae bacterium]|nr:SPFH domain-containing protein [Polyangiaceae bacterium]
MDELVKTGTELALWESPWLPLAALLVVALVWVALLLLNQLLCICGPNEILVISGRSHVLADGSSVGYNVLHGGRGIRIPILEEVNRMDTRIVPVMVEVKNAYSKGGIPLVVHAIANVKISTDPNLVRNAIERLLNVPPAGIASVARQTLEGVLREVVAQLTPEEVNEDRLKFAGTLMRNAKEDFDKLGLELDVLKVQSVSDDQGYLNSLGRALIANMIRDAENAENRARQVIAEAEAEARQRAETAAKQAETTVLTARNQLRAELAKFEAEAKAVENEAAMAEQTARAEAEQELQLLRAELERRRLEVEVTIPAEAARRAAEAQARAEAAPALEAGKGTAEALGLLSEQWGHAGGAGRELYVLQHLDELVAHAADRVSKSRLGELSVVDGGDGQSYARAVAMYPAAVAQVMMAVGEVLGADMRKILTGDTDPASAARPLPAQSAE